MILFAAMSGIFEIIQIYPCSCIDNVYKKNFGKFPMYVCIYHKYHCKFIYICAIMNIYVHSSIYANIFMFIIHDVYKKNFGKISMCEVNRLYVYNSIYLCICPGIYLHR